MTRHKDTFVVILLVLILFLLVLMILKPIRASAGTAETLSSQLRPQTDSSNGSLDSELSAGPLLPINVPTRGYYGDFDQVGYLEPLKKDPLKTDPLKNLEPRKHCVGCASKNKCRCAICLSNSDQSEATPNQSEATSDQSDESRAHQMLRLYGRQIDGYRYEYYALNHRDAGIKISLSNDHEISSDDTVFVPGYGPYRAQIYQPTLPNFLL